MKKLRMITYALTAFCLLLLNSRQTVHASTTYSSEWESYSSYYYYNQMTEDEQALYNKLNALCLSYLEGTANISNNMTAACSYSGLTNEQALNVANLFRYSNPQYYFLTSNISISYKQLEGNVSLGIYSAFADGTARKSATNTFKSKIESYLKQIDKETTVLAKEKKAHDLIIANTSRVAGSAYNQSPYSVFVNGKSDCKGYAAAFSILCNASDIPAIIVTSGTHAWNYVLLENSWYNVDCTMDDDEALYSSTRLYTYFNRSTAKLSALNSNIDYEPESFYASYLPTCLLDSGATATSSGSITTSTKTAATPVIRSEVINKQTTVTISTTTSNAKIYYTLDNSTPSQASGKSMLYTGPFTISKNVTVKAVTVADNYTDSSVAKANLIAAVEKAATPSISKQPASKTYTYGSKATALSVTASIKDSGTLSYQWYKNTKNSTSSGTAISGATSSTYTPSVSSVGTTYYYCIVTNTNQYATTKTAKTTSSVATVKVNAKSISSINVSGLAAKTYTGSAQTQKLSITLGAVTLKANTDYTVSYKNNKAIGTATVTIKGKGNYTGSKSYQFKINPKKMSLKTLTAQTKKMKISWKKDSTITGYTLQYSTSKSFSTVKTITINKKSTTACTIKNLPSNKTYYVRIRGYKTVNGKTYTGSWSTAKSVKIK